MNGRGDFGSSSSRNSDDSTTNSTTFQQGGFYSGSYALPGAFGDAGQTPGAVFSAAAAPAASTSSVETSTPMVLGSTPPRPPAAASVAWGGAASAAPHVLFALGLAQQHLQLQVRALVVNRSRPRAVGTAPNYFRHAVLRPPGAARLAFFHGSLAGSHFDNVCGDTLT